MIYYFIKMAFYSMSEKKHKSSSRCSNFQFYEKSKFVLGSEQYFWEGLGVARWKNWFCCKTWCPTGQAALESFFVTSLRISKWQYDDRRMRMLMASWLAWYSKINFKFSFIPHVPASLSLGVGVARILASVEFQISFWSEICPRSNNKKKFGHSSPLSYPHDLKSWK